MININYFKEITSMKRMICLAMCVLAAVGASACGKDEAPAPTQAQPETAVIEQTETSAAPTEEGSLSLKSFVAEFDKTPTVYEKLIYEDDNISVRVTGIDYTAISGPGLQLDIENRYKKDIIIQAPYAVVNGYMVSPEISIEVPAEKSGSGTLTLPYFNLAISEISTLRNIEFALRIVEAKSYNPLDKTDLITVKSSAEQTEDKECDESGQVAYDEDDIKIILKGVNTDRAYSDGAELMVYLYNGTDRNIAVQTSEVIVNGYDMTSAMNRTILPERRAVDVVTFYTPDMEEHDIEEIDSVNVSFEIKDADSWETLSSTDSISVELPQKETAAETVQATE